MMRRVDDQADCPALLRALVSGWMVFLLGVLAGVAAAPVQAEWWLYGGIGAAQSAVNEKPNLWKQTGFPSEYSGTDLGWRTGLGTGLALATTAAFGMPVTHGLFLELGAVSLGAPEIRSRFVPDDHLRAGTGRCYQQCGPEDQRTLHLQNSYLGGELVVGYQATVLDLFQPYLKTGVAGFAHTHRGSVTRPASSWHFDGNNQPTTENLEGVLIAAVLGGGLCGDVYRGMTLCGDVEKFFPLAHTANPLIDTGAGGPVLTTVQLRVPFEWGFGTTRDYLWQR